MKRKEGEKPLHILKSDDSKAVEKSALRKKTTVAFCRGVKLVVTGASIKPLSRSVSRAQWKGNQKRSTPRSPTGWGKGFLYTIQGRPNRNTFRKRERRPISK